MPGAYKTLTVKREAFVRAYLELGNATEAYHQVFNEQGKGNYNRASCARNAHALLEDKKVLDYLSKLKSEREQLVAKTLAKTVTRTFEELRAEAIAEQEFAMKMAAEAGNAIAYSAASERKAKLNRVFVEQSEVRTGQLDPEEAKPDIASLWSRLEQNKGNETQH